LSKGKAEGGFGGNSAFPLRNQIVDSPAVLLVKSRTPHKSFLFLLEEKIGARKLKTVKKTFLRGGEVSERRRGWLPYWGFCSKKVRTSIKKHRQFSEFGFCFAKCAAKKNL
jgi:hypothetical protein